MQANSLYQETDVYSVEVYKTHEDWLNSRGKGFGGSDASAVCDLSRFKTLQDLWFEKVKGQKKTVSGPNVEYGKTCEPALRTLYSAKHPAQQIQYIEDAVLISKQYPFLRYSPDGLLISEDGRPGILEIKTSQIQNGKKSAEWQNGVPVEYYLQILHGLLVTSFDFVTLTAELRYWDGRVEIVERTYRWPEVEDDLWELLQKETEAWNLYFKDGQTIPPLSLGRLK